MAPAREKETASSAQPGRPTSSETRSPTPPQPPTREVPVQSELQNAPFKEMFRPATAEWLARRIEAVHGAFPSATFLAEVLPVLPSLELKARVELLADALGRHLPAYLTARDILIAALGPDEGPPEGEDFGDFRWMPVNRYISKFGLDHFEASMDALKALTRRFSSEFDVRFFIQQYPEQALATLLDWADDPDWRVRRLVSEGSRPRLPWGIRLQRYVQSPHEPLQLLEKLRHDPHSAVRRSVANHLNDIAKDHPARVVEVSERWLSHATASLREQKRVSELEALVRHGLRHLIKQGDAATLKLLGYSMGEPVTLQSLQLGRRQVRVGESLLLTLSLHNPGASPVKVLLDYEVHHQKANGTLSPKVFKWTEKTLQPGEHWTLTKQHSFKPVTTRVYYPGLHAISVLVNGHRMGWETFVLETV